MSRWSTISYRSHHSPHHSKTSDNWCSTLFSGSFVSDVIDLLALTLTMMAVFLNAEIISLGFSRMNALFIITESHSALNNTHQRNSSTISLYKINFTRDPLKFFLQNVINEFLRHSKRLGRGSLKAWRFLCEFYKVYGNVFIFTFLDDPVKSLLCSQIRLSYIDVPIAWLSKR